MRLAPLRAPACFGTADGVTIALGLIVSLSGQPHAVIHAAAGAGLAELPGMAAGQYLSDREAGIPAAAANGLAATAGCLIPAVPYLITSGSAALISSLLLVAAVAGAVAWLRPQRSTTAILQTLGVLSCAALLCWAASLL